jgi:hypothetical protein
VLNLWGVEVPAIPSTCHLQCESAVYVLEVTKNAKSLSGKFRNRELNAGTAVDVTRGTLTVVCVTHQGGVMKAAVIPREIAETIDVTPPELLD